MNLVLSGNKRRAVLLLLLAGAALLAIFGEKTPSGTVLVRATRGAGDVQPRPPAPQRRVHPAESLEPIVALIPRDELIPGTKGVHARDLFASSPPPRPVMQSAPVVVPPAPLPFRYIGKKQEGGVWEVYLGRGDDSSFIVRAGSTLDTGYRIDKIEPPTLTLTHLPTGQTQTLGIGEAW